MRLGPLYVDILICLAYFLAGIASQPAAWLDWLAGTLQVSCSNMYLLVYVLPTVVCYLEGRSE